MQSTGKPEPELNDGFEQGCWQVPYFDPPSWAMARLSADGTTPAAFDLIGTKTTSCEVVAHIFLPPGKPEYGSAAAEQEDGVVRDSVSLQEEPPY